MKFSFFVSSSSSSSSFSAATTLLLAWTIATTLTTKTSTTTTTTTTPSIFFADASKDSDYYFPGFHNPLQDAYSMYWKDSINVLQDLDQFQALYIKYHSCVWSKYGSRYGSGQDYDEQGANANDWDAGNGCGGFGGENYWYMGRTQCFKANVAYSLYGILKNNDAAASQGTYCRKDTYINSFFTTFGVESFAGPLGLGVNTANSYCTAVAPDNNNDMYIDDDAAYADVAADDDYLDNNDYQYYNYAAYSSYGTGCSADGSFVMDSYSGAFCHGSNYVETTDTLDSFNQAMESLECTQIYDASNNNNNNNNNNNDRQLENNNQDEIDFEELQAVYILAYSKSCSLRQYPHDCPDPFGLKKKYANQMNAALSYKTGLNRDIGTKLIKTFTSLSFVTGVFFLLISLVLHRRNRKRFQLEKRKANRKKKRKGSQNAAASPSSSASKATTTMTMSEDEDTNNNRMDQSNNNNNRNDNADKSSSDKQGERRNRLWPFRGRSSPTRKGSEAGNHDVNAKYPENEQQQQQQQGWYSVAPDAVDGHAIPPMYSQPIVNMNQSQQQQEDEGTINTDAVEQQARSASSNVIQDLLNTSSDAVSAAVVATSSFLNVSANGSETPIQVTDKPESETTKTAAMTPTADEEKEEEAQVSPPRKAVEEFTATTTEAVDKEEEAEPPAGSSTTPIKYMQIDTSTPATTYTYSEESSNIMNKSFQDNLHNKSSITSNSSFDDSLYSPNVGGDGSMTFQRTRSRMVGQEVVPEWTTFEKSFGGDDDSPPRRLHKSSSSPSRVTKRRHSPSKAAAAAAAAAPDDFVPFDSDEDGGLEGDGVMNMNNVSRRTGSGNFIRSFSRNFFRKQHG